MSGLNFLLARIWYYLDDLLLVAALLLVALPVALWALTRGYRVLRYLWKKAALEIEAAVIDTPIKTDKKDE